MAAETVFGQFRPNDISPHPPKAKAECGTRSHGIGTLYIERLHSLVAVLFPVVAAAAVDADGRDRQTQTDQFGQRDGDQKAGESGEVGGCRIGVVADAVFFGRVGLKITLALLVYRCTSNASTPLVLPVVGELALCMLGVHRRGLLLRQADLLLHPQLGGHVLNGSGELAPGVHAGGRHRIAPRF